MMSWISRFLALVLMAGAFVATGAQAQVITPNPTTFTVAGVMNFEAWPSCNFTMTFDVPAGGASATVTSAAVTGGAGCEQRSFTGLPWTVRVGPQVLHIDNFEMLFGPAYPTGKQTLDVYWSNYPGYPSSGFFSASIGLSSTMGFMEVTSGQTIAIN
ncbi:hypothetical protein DDF65_13635 [Caulobacter radicis]|uniref:Uncharacterized protein n=2 Tax=Caulobacter radicis TaxID=2172650 RepID=A0A2T9JDJ8_9CAUL|nr:hypothetical protein DDF65_13635 [Caulobacter radicis]